MTSALITLIILGAIALLWLDGARARELATAIANEVCRRRGVQLLDQTVSLSRMALRRTAGGLRFRRMFRFDYSIEGVGRRTGYVLLIGVHLEQVDLGLPDEPAGEQPDTPPPEDSKVVPFKRRH